MKYLLALILTFVVVTCTAYDLQDLLKYHTCNLAYGIQIPDTGIDVYDFSQRYPNKMQSYDSHMSISGEPILMGSYDSWYWSDFSSDPFDGIIEVLVVGEPLPSSTVTFFLALGLVGLVYCKRCCHRDCPTTL